MMDDGFSQQEISYCLAYVQKFMRSGLINARFINRNAHRFLNFIQASK